jgi:adenosylmethionine-8-amino-7-oxononanoate aminotransferase
MGHLLTFGGHPVACAAAIRNLEIFDEENLVEKGNEMGTYLGQQLETLTSHPSVGQVRGVGMVWGLDLVSNKETREKFAKDSKFKKALGQLLMDRNIVTRVWDVMHFAPPLVVTKAEIDDLITKVDEALTLAESEYAAELVA